MLLRHDTTKNMWDCWIVGIHSCGWRSCICVGIPTQLLRLNRNRSFLFCRKFPMGTLMLEIKSKTENRKHKRHPKWLNKKMCRHSELHVFTSFLFFSFFSCNVLDAFATLKIIIFLDKFSFWESQVKHFSFHNDKKKKRVAPTKFIFCRVHAIYGIIQNIWTKITICGCCAQMLWGRLHGTGRHETICNQLPLSASRATHVSLFSMLHVPAVWAMLPTQAPKINAW